MANASASGGSQRGGVAKTMVADQISQAIQSTSNLLRLMHQSSPAQAQLQKLPKNLLAKTSTIKNTGQVLEQMPHIISSLDAYMEKGLESAARLQTVGQLLSKMESCQLKHFSQSQFPEEKNQSSRQSLD